MALDVVFFNFRNFAFKPEDVSFGDGETIDVRINANGDVTTIPIRKRTATLTLNGARATDLAVLENERDQNVRNLINGSAVLENVDVFGYLLENAILTNVVPSNPISVEGIQLFDSIELTLESQTFS